MMINLIRLFLILSITFAPVGQSIAMDIVDMGTMTEACLDCTHNMDENDNTCVNSECFQEACLGSFTVPALSIIDTSIALDFDKPSFRFRDLYSQNFISQISLPLYRPPIA
ncbi:MAG: hypothetical protein HOM14_18240 [Gammaproteobacteria bacterium]|jgi:hypothetical protein|nr:hypothetical protein [Gammaproteobacteria bacterium]MBT3722693.1 hypothetical protein [Gammaproteobacteria bacterium]MBT4078969.1 hypothetical protein [Gammaproteobacteria bacterium]MBT4194696.1 hypothetical protein [Gammaproteobacteria bacterium]MBT4450772.1 hypothetical protein [Gammaproteobacteria bacterium]